MDLILKKTVPVICIALAAPLVLSSCSRTVSSSEATAPASSVVQEQVSPEYYEDLGDGVYQGYVKIDGKTVPYVCVDSATGDYHG